MGESRMNQVPKDAFVDHVIHQAKEYGTYDSPPTVGGGPRGPQKDVDWSFDGVDSWDIDRTNSGFVMHGVCEGSYSVQVTPARYNPPGKAHPAEYEWRNVDVKVVIDVDVENPPDGVWGYDIKTGVM